MYRFLDKSGNLLYVGKAKDLRSRVSSYFTNDGHLGEKTRIMVSQIDKIDITVVESEIESLLLEAYIIKKFQPKYNIRMTDGKSYPLIQITLKDQFPAILFARKPEDPQSVYFGPYPSSGSVKMVLRILRRAFPFVSVRNHPKRICLYHHLGLCPCPPVFGSKEMQKNYRKTIKQIIGILEGNTRNILREMEHDRDVFVKEERFEEAKTLQAQITALSYITQPFRQAFEYDTNPNLRSDVREKELADLKEILQKNGLAVETLIKIECYDISHIQGTNTTASMVVFVNGEKESNLYRKFKIRLEKTPDDFASMEEVLTRRFKHTEWDYPDLLIVDGGKGQVSSAQSVLSKLDLKIPLIGLAKREETIVIPNPKSEFRNSKQYINSKFESTKHFANYNYDIRNFIEVSLPKTSPGLTLIRRIRDEAHRFAVTYHKLRRSKEFILAD